MNTLHLVAPAYRAAATVIPIFDYDTQPIEDIRQNLEKAYESAYGAPDIHLFEEIFIERNEVEKVRTLLFRPNDGPARGAILHLHGGGWIAGSADMFAPYCAELANRHSAIVLSVDYHRVPEVAGHVALEESLVALRWLREQASVLGFKPETIVVMGDSAGGSLAAGVALLARDEAIPLKGQLLIYPALDDRRVRRNAPVRNPFGGEFVLPLSYLRQLWGARLKNVAIDSLPYLAPARTDDLSSLAPAFMAVGSLDFLVDDSIEYAGRLIRAGVKTELHVYDGVFHGFDLVPGPETDAFKADLFRAIEKYFQEV